MNISLIAEGSLDEQVLRQLIAQTATHLQPGVCYGKKGRSWMDTNLAKYNEAARSWPFVSLADLEGNECPPKLLQIWFPHGIHANMRPRIAVRMLESWLLADRQSIAQFLGISTQHIPQMPDNEANPKLVMVSLARRSRYRVIKEDMVPTHGASSLVGKNYRGQLERFVVEKWQADNAQIYSPSLQRTIQSLQQFRPVIPTH